MGRLMGSSNSNNYGEQIFINKASEYLDDTNIIYWNRQLFGKEFDVCILMPEKGILVVELKCGGAHSMSQGGVYGKERDNTG